MKYRLFLILLMLSALGRAADLQTLMEQGNQYYQQEAYVEAVETYEKILTNELPTDAYMYILGCPYSNRARLGPAILHFRKAEALIPRDEDVQYNLELARMARKDRFDLPQPMPLVQFFMDLRESIPTRDLRLLVVLFWVSFLLAILLYRWLRGKAVSRVFFLTSIALGIIFGLTLGWYLDRRAQTGGSGVVILAETATGHSAPIENSETLFVAHEGSEGRVLEKAGEWYEVKLPDGKEAWFPASDLALF